MGSKKTLKKVGNKKPKPKPKPNTSLMDQVAKNNPSFVDWLKNKKSNRQ